MTRLLVMPALNRLFPGLAHMRAPNSGIYLFNRALITHTELIGDFSADLDVMIRVHAAGAIVTEVDIGQIVHDQRDLLHYNGMAETIMAFFLRQSEMRITREVIVLAQDAEQVITNSLGVLAAHSIAGGPVSVYLAEPDTAAADALRNALAPFPTAHVEPLENAANFRPPSHASELCFMAPYPAANEDRAIRMALQLRDIYLETKKAELLLMPLGPERGAVDGFKADIALEIGKGADIKRAALAKIQATPGKTSLREMFQSFQSLPDALIHAVGADAHPEAGNM